MKNKIAISAHLTFLDNEVTKQWIPINHEKVICIDEAHVKKEEIIVLLLEYLSAGFEVQ